MEGENATWDGSWSPCASETRRSILSMNRPLTPPARPKPPRHGEGPSLPPTVFSAAMTQVGGREIGRGGTQTVQG